MLNLPNALTTLRIFLVPLLVVVLLTVRETPILGLVIFLLALLTDYLDGFLARRRSEETTLGALLDPVADKLLTAAAFISLVELDFAPAWMVVVIIGREFAVSGLRSIASSQGVTIPASRWGKYKTGSQGVAISLLIMTKHLGEFRWLGEAALWIVMLFAFISGADYFRTFYRRLGLNGGAPGRA
ncbi:MAG: CDP-diacylglycerol--glycerol-3-phosphate 3-phosphatidyltransferase [Acidobacteriota bacterium]